MVTLRPCSEVLYCIVFRGRNCTNYSQKIDRAVLRNRGQSFYVPKETNSSTMNVKNGEVFELLILFVGIDNDSESRGNFIHGLMVYSPSNNTTALKLHIQARGFVSI